MPAHPRYRINLLASERAFLEKLIAAHGTEQQIVRRARIVLFANGEGWSNQAIADEQLGLGYLRVPTWAPFRLQAYFNGHAWLARQLRAAEIPFTMADNAFMEIGDWQAAQRLADSLDAQTLHQRLDEWAQRFCRVVSHFHSGYH